MTFKPNITKTKEELAMYLSQQNEEICQILGKALGYPWFKDDQKNFPDAIEEHGVCVGEHVAETIAEEAATKIKELKARLELSSISANRTAGMLLSVREARDRAEARVLELEKQLEGLV